MKKPPKRPAAPSPLPSMPAENPFSLPDGWSLHMAMTNTEANVFSVGSKSAAEVAEHMEEIIKKLGKIQVPKKMTMIRNPADPNNVYLADFSRLYGYNPPLPDLQW